MNWNFLLKIYNFSRFSVTKFCTPPQAATQGKILFANASKVIRNWFLTLQPEVSTRKGMDIIICLCTNACTYLCICVKERKASLNSYTNFIFEVINIDFQQIWHFGVTGWVGLELASF